MTNFYKSLNDAIDIIEKKYKYFKLLVIKNSDTDNLFGEFLDRIGQKVKNIEKICVPNMSDGLGSATDLVNAQITDDVGLIINMATDICIEDIHAANIDKMLVLDSPNLLLLLKHYDYVVADYNVLSSCNYKKIANCYGQLSSISFYILEQVFCKAVYSNNVDNNKLLALEEVIHSLTQLPTPVLRTGFGKIMLFKLCCRVSELLDYESYMDSFVYRLSSAIINKNRYKNIGFGESCAISMILGFKTLKVVLNANGLSKDVGFSYGDRMAFAKRCNDKFSLSSIYRSFVCDDNLGEHIDNFTNIKSSFKTVFETYSGLVSKLVSRFKKLYFDNGVFLKKYMSSSVLLTAVNSLPETYTKCSYSVFLRDVGLMNSLIV